MRDVKGVSLPCFSEQTYRLSASMLHVRFHAEMTPCQTVCVLGRKLPKAERNCLGATGIQTFAFVSAEMPFETFIRRCVVGIWSGLKHGRRLWLEVTINDEFFSLDSFIFWGKLLFCVTSQKIIFLGGCCSFWKYFYFPGLIPVNFFFNIFVRVCVQQLKMGHGLWTPLKHGGCSFGNLLVMSPVSVQRSEHCSCVILFRLRRRVGNGESRFVGLKAWIVERDLRWSVGFVSVREFFQITPTRMKFYWHPVTLRMSDECPHVEICFAWWWFLPSG